VEKASPVVTTGALADAADAAPAAVWRSAVAAVESPTLGSALKQATLVALGSPEVRIRFASGTRFPDMVERKRAAVEKAFSAHLGRPVKLAIEVGPVQATPDVPAPVASIASVERAEREARAARIRDEARSHPNIQEAAKLLGADIEGTDEL
jgi:DNA polymerase-3 subunit gamma/tau